VTRYVLLVPLLLAACGSAPVEIKALTYNVAGLPEGISGSHPEHNTPLISPLLNPYDLVVVQEDFTYHDLLVSKATHPYRSRTKTPAVKVTGDGLNFFSRYAFDPAAVYREEWVVCNGGIDGSGSDCLAEKGYAKATINFSDDIAVDVFTLHCDASGGDLDQAVRARQVEQLIAATSSSSNAIIVAGDTNLRLSRPMDVMTLERLKSGASLTDSCAATSCPDDDHIDRFLFRSSDRVLIEAVSWGIDGAMLDEMGEDLSDHPAIIVTFRFTPR